MHVNKSNYEYTFAKIFDKDRIKKYLNKQVDILKIFIEKILNLHTLHIEKIRSIMNKLNILDQPINIINKKNITDIVNKINENNFDTIYDIIFDLYITICKGTCFGGFGNTPGYYLLSQIDYNAYFKEIFPEIMISSNVDGIYVENDQDEIIFFNIKNLNKMSIINYILPYKFYSKTDNIENAKIFIQEYIRTSALYKSDEKNVEYREKMIDIIKEFNYINHEKKQLWNFSWFLTFCEKYNPYEDINITESNCKKLFNSKLHTEEYCIKRYELNLTNDHMYVECDHDDNITLTTNKISILNIKEHSELLKDWMKKINYFNNDKLQIYHSICNNIN